MWDFLRKNTFVAVRLGQRYSTATILLAALAIFASLFPRAIAAQDSAPIPPAVQAQLDALASRVAAQIRLSKVDPESTNVFVFDFQNASGKQFSKLGAALADRFSKILANHANGFVVLDRQLLTSYLKENWIDQREIQGTGVRLALARSMGAAGIVQGDLQEDPDQQLLLTLLLEGFGPAWSTETLIPLTSEVQSLLKEPLSTYARSLPLPIEPGVLTAGVDGVGVPECVYCPPPLYNEIARAAKFQGTIELSVVVTPDGSSDSVLVLKGAPFSLNKQAIDAVQKWRFKPAKKNGKPVPVRVPIEITLRLN